MNLRRIGILVCLAALIAPLAPAASFGATEAQFANQNLLGAFKLWGDIKLFDPELTRNGVDWNAALTQAEPAIASAHDTASYEAAIQSLIAPLHDPATHIENDTAVAGAHISEERLGNATLIIVPHGIGDSLGMLSADIWKAVASAEGAAIVVDLRGVNEANSNDSAALNYLFSDSSPLLSLVQGTFTMPRERSRSYFGYPSEVNGGYAGYSSQDVLSEPEQVKGTSNVPHTFAFLVDENTSLPSLALGMAQAGKAVISSSRGRPSILATGVASMVLPYGVNVTFRTGDLADIAQPLQIETTTSAGDAVMRAAAPPHASYPTPRDLTSNDVEYSDVLFPSEAMRMLAVAKMYNVIRYFSPYRALMHDNWEAAALQAIADERTATNERSYLLGLMKFYAHLHDSHGFFRGAVVENEFGAGVPFQARYLHRQVVVAQTFLPANGMQGVKAGDVIDAVDGVPIRQAMDRVEQYLCSSTPQSADHKALLPSGQPSVFSGEKGTPIRFVFHAPGGSRQTRSLVRDTFMPVPPGYEPTYFILPGNVGYVDFDRLLPSQTGAMFDALQNTRSIIFDNRGYPHAAAWTVAPRLANAKKNVALFYTPLARTPLDVEVLDEQRLPAYQEFYQTIAAARPRYIKPTVMLIDERAISQSEHSALFFREANHTLFVGTPTQGADGDVTGMVLPGGIGVSFSGEGVRHAGGAQLQRVGIIPDVYAEPTAADIARGNDVVLQKGLDVALRSAGVSTALRNIALTQERAREYAAFTKPATSTAVSSVKGTHEQALALAWRTNSTDYKGSTILHAGYAGTQELRLENATPTPAQSFGSFAAWLPLESYRDSTIRIRGYLRAENVTKGAGFWLRIDGPTPAFDNMQNRWLTGTTEWKPFAIVLHVSPDATGAYAGLLLVGTGTAEASAITIDVVPENTPTTNMF